MTDNYKLDILYYYYYINLYIFFVVPEEGTLFLQILTSLHRPTAPQHGGRKGARLSSLPLQSLSHERREEANGRHSLGRVPRPQKENRPCLAQGSAKRELHSF